MTDKYQKVLSTVIATIRPSDQNMESVQQVVSMIEGMLKKAKLDVKVGIGGSYAKNTHLRGDHDVDLFIQFATKYKSEEISELTEKALRTLKLERLHGSRDYFHHHSDGMQYEIVPVMVIEKGQEAHNITDYSPMHVEWVKKMGKGLNDEIRAAKKFCKANRCYGAESYIRGFSGHVLDILVIHYGGFIKLLQASQKWKDKQVIDHYDRHKGAALANLNKAKLLSPLVLIDPVQPDRNASSALSEENYRRFIAAAKGFLKKPDVSYFEEKKFNPDKIHEMENSVVLKIEPIEAKEDKAGAKIVQIYESLHSALSPFGIKDSGWEWKGEGIAYIWFLLDTDALPDMREQMGPPAKMEEHASLFKKKYPNATLRGGRLIAIVPNKIRTPRQAIEANANYINDRATSYELL